jgi:hypothetical protein
VSSWVADFPPTVSAAPADGTLPSEASSTSEPRTDPVRSSAWPTASDRTSDLPTAPLRMSPFVTESDPASEKNPPAATTSAAAASVAPDVLNPAMACLRVLGRQMQG